jgi:hypothetical protein
MGCNFPVLIEYPFGNANTPNCLKEIGTMAVDKDILRQSHALINENRVACLWFLREDFLPEDTEGLVRAMTYIERHGNRDTYIKARKIREWLLRNINETSAG